MIFVDTGAWFALSVESDPDHLAAQYFIAENREPLVTSDYIVDELLNLFVFRRQKEKGIKWLAGVLDAGGVELLAIDASCFTDASQLYRTYMDKSWSFTDCTSYVVMKRHSISKAFSFDNHFRQFGTVQVVP